MRNFRNLIVWQKSILFSIQIYEITRLFPPEEKFGLVSQLRRAAVSIPSNIAEGCSKATDAHFKKYLEDAIGSAFEVETQLLITCRVYTHLQENIEKLLPLMNEVQKMLNSMVEKLKI
jgi:four helix bundle protein